MWTGIEMKVAEPPVMVVCFGRSSLLKPFIIAEKLKIWSVITLPSRKQTVWI